MQQRSISQKRSEQSRYKQLTRDVTDTSHFFNLQMDTVLCEDGRKRTTCIITTHLLNCEPCRRLFFVFFVEAVILQLYIWFKKPSGESEFGKCFWLFEPFLEMLPTATVYLTEIIWSSSELMNTVTLIGTKPKVVTKANWWPYSGEHMAPSTGRVSTYKN